ncbi:hypothetical protein SBA3_2930002 [Candidatus Sulfopaludibacter sp. SbA3]|nr:hypothetical protein SBA3_2930002 [Candidatus Sulfopaludibacter sp. SbA3]
MTALAEAEVNTEEDVRELRCALIKLAQAEASRQFQAYRTTRKN